ncbi:putative malate dehydrogenase [Irpex rosettiformis]|uniref:Malate dehydrogenase n=1 Tax=Irpex rosettiformis TaxID=378272 RepID=A0ACB8U823_9APHY|nr:putative malate dehydrogenase [Irpex rosettiformis]
MQFASLLVTLFASTYIVFAAPAKTSHCDLSHVSLNFPTSPTGTPLATAIAPAPKFLGVGVGTQNYTCSAAGTYTSAGAYAEIFDVSCLPTKDSYASITRLAFDVWKIAPKSWTPAEVVKTLSELHSPVVLGQHYFISNVAGTALSPKWDFTSASEAGHTDAFVVGAKTGDIPAPINPAENIDWLSLSGTSGDLANQIFRLETNGGQPPSSCTPGSPEIFIRYSSLYAFYGGSF